MRNASDIFCLNEQGTDGMQMFSVNGNCPMRIKRRNHLRENDVFEYGRPSSNESLGRGDDITDKLESGDKLNADDSVFMADHEADRMIPEDYDARSTVSEKGDQKGEDPKRDTEIQFHKLNQASGSKEQVTTSTIMRNPLTGAGMEIKEHRKPKKGLKHLNDKWMW